MGREAVIARAAGIHLIDEPTGGPCAAHVDFLDTAGADQALEGAVHVPESRLPDRDVRVVGIDAHPAFRLRAVAAPVPEADAVAALGDREHVPAAGVSQALDVRPGPAVDPDLRRRPPRDRHEGGALRLVPGAVGPGRITQVASTDVEQSVPAGIAHDDIARPLGSATA